jgi:hypothetical protein|tara:strand:- start:211 stop:453 length:243 start_codon:yes stop_codon:yes gene_type:complete
MVINLRNIAWDTDGVELSADAKVGRMKRHRNRLLSESDWTQASDNPISNKAAWATYRQELRDFPATWTPAETVTFPDPPS